MARRRTINRDPLSEVPADATYSAEIVRIPIPGNAVANDSVAQSTERTANIRPKPTVAISAKASRAVGGRLEILGGDLGTGSRVIWPLGSESRVGFVAPTGRTVDLGRELDAAQAWPDLTEHRYLSAMGWAWVLASLGGIIGLMAGGGLRLLQPRRMIVTMQLSDGSKLVARTDGVTADGLKSFAQSRRAARA